MKTSENAPLEKAKTERWGKVKCAITWDYVFVHGSEREHDPGLCDAGVALPPESKAGFNEGEDVTF